MGLTPQQERIALRPDKALFVEAGAGSGKTFTLMQRVVWALSPQSGPYLNSLDEALVITFTEKAASEIKERVRKGLHEAGLTAAALEVDNAWISTIHGMCSRILHAHALELGLDPNFSVLGEHRTNELRTMAVEKVIGRVTRDPAYAELFAEYPTRAYTPWGESAVSVAGMVDELLKAAAAAPQGFDSLNYPGEPAKLALELPSLLMGYQQLAEMRINTEEERLEVEASAARLEAFLQEKPASSRTTSEIVEALEALHRPNGRYWKAKAVKPAADEVRSERARLIAEAQLTRVRDLLFQLVELAREAQVLFDEAKRAACGLDNDDLLRLALDALRRPAIAAEYCGRFKMVMIDEFQDTSTQQVEMVKLLSGEGAEHLTTVGDAQQSIYRFRGADVGVFRARRAEVAAQDPELVSQMSANFRSHDDILRAVERVCNRPNMIDGFMDLTANPGRADGLAGVGLPRLNLELTVSVTNGHKKPKSEQVAAVLAAQVADRLACFAREGVRAKDMAVLLRGMRVADLYVSALRARGLDCVVTGGSTFSKAPEVLEVAALLRALANPHNTQEGLYPVLTGEMFEVDADDLMVLRTTAREQTGEPASHGIERGLLDFDPFAGLEPSSRLVAALNVLGRAFSRLGSRPIHKILLQVVRESGWLARLEAQGVSGRARAANVLAAIRHVRELVDEMGLGVARASSEFDLWLGVAKESPAALMGGEADAVRIMTVHASKGLEFPVVALADCLSDPRTNRSGLLVLGDGPQSHVLLRPQKMPDTKDILPDEGGSSRSLLEVNAELEDRDSREEREEIARLLYVGLTRAREALVFACPVSRLKNPRKDGSCFTPSMMGAVVDGYLDGELPADGETEFSYGGSAPGVARCVRLSIEGQQLAGSSAGTLEGFNGELPSDPLALCVHPWEGDVPAERSFTFYETDEFELPPLETWNPRAGVYSYSSARATIDAEHGDAREQLLWYDEENDKEPAFDADRATALGSALHRCCQRMVDEGLGANERLGDEAVASIAASCGLRLRQRERLYAALALWSQSALRAEVLKWPSLRAEAPFFCHEPSRFGDYVTGAIDLLASDDAQNKALVIDYKTGEREASFEDFEANHEMQARFYARVLIDAGYHEVECVFVAVERVQGGEPMVARYGFTSAAPPAIA